MSMGSNIRQKRKQEGLTQQELADMLGLQKSAIAKYENGRVQNIKRSTLEKMAAILHCTPSFLMGFEDNPSLIEEDKEAVTERTIRLSKYYELCHQLNNDNLERLNKYAETLLSLQQQEENFSS
ncbi:MAG: helix-turn-helix domain-containing protein [Lachnospiraceae bacterium]